MRQRVRLRLAIILGYIVLAAACTPAPPTLSPNAQRDFNNTRMIQALDVLRDGAIAANAQTPPLISTTTTRKIVFYHQTTLKAIDASKSGWKPATQITLFQLMSDPSIPIAEHAVLQPYFNLAKAVLDSF